MSDSPKSDRKPRAEAIRELLKPQLAAEQPVASIAEYISKVRGVSEAWQKEDWNDTESDEECVLNNARLVGQAWFRGHADCSLSLSPGLYRESTWGQLKKRPDSLIPADDIDHELSIELFHLEHDLRIDFTSYAHLLNQSNQAQTAIDWYFLMQHHGLPTRLLDWSTNALAALFFALDGYSQQETIKRRYKADAVSSEENANLVAVWMFDAYWLAGHLNEDWGGPLLPWAEDAARYIPPLDRLVDKMSDSRALLPLSAMPMEPPAMHPRVAAQEGRFVIFGGTTDLLDERLRLNMKDDCTIEELRVRQIKFLVEDADSLLRDLAQFGVSKRTLFPDLAGVAEFVRWKHFHKVIGY